MLPQNSAKQALLLTALKKVLRYDPHTGLFHWKIETQAHGGRIKPGDPAGTLRSDGYVQIGFKGHIFRAHRLAWWFVKGELPSELDHKNGIRSDNRWRNLRLVTRTQNNINPVNRLRSDNKSGHRGVSWKTHRSGRSCWHARITVNGRVILLGDYADLEQAVAARKKAERRYFIS